MFKPLLRILDNIISLNIDDIMLEILKQEDDVIELIVDLNTNGQLFQGIDSKGNDLGTYTQITIAIKRSKGQPTDRVTLKDTGDYYKSFDVKPYKGGFEIISDPIKEGFNLEDKYGSDLESLTEYSLEELKFFLIPLIREYVLNKILER